MTAKEFKLEWNSRFPETDPIGFTLKWVYQKRWFRIHSLSASKRYAQIKEESNILLNRQNQIIDHLLDPRDIHQKKLFTKHLKQFLAQSGPQRTRKDYN